MTDVTLKEYVDRRFEEQEKHISRALTALDRSADKTQANLVTALSVAALLLSAINIALWIYHGSPK